jgi:hypothetical protein
LLHARTRFGGGGRILKKCAAVGDSGGERDALGWTDHLGHDCAW